MVDTSSNSGYFIDMTTNSKKLLYISASPTGEYSTSRQIAAEFLATWKSTNPDSQVLVRDLSKETIPHLDAEAIFANYTPVESQSPSMAQKHSFRMALINEILSVDEILISAPLWNWSIPSVLKSYIDQIVVTGVLDNGKPGLKDKKVTFVIAQGGSYKEGTPKAGWDFATGYLELVAKALGATDIETILAEFTLAGVAPGMDFLKDAKANSIEAAISAAKKRAA
jgi:FMN-dependent NADH-azoreductase